MSKSGWRAVDAFAGGGPLAAVEAAIAAADLSGERFQSDAGGRALLLPARPLAEGDVPGIAVTGARAEDVQVLFLDPADGAGALSLLAALGARGRGVWVALPSNADPTGLIPGAGRVTVAVGAGSAVDYELFGVADPGTLDLTHVADAPTLGEDADGLQQRSKWFQAREGRGD
jgi:hypothetical protein